MTRIALNYTGLIRTWEQCCYNHHENIITPDCDMYWFTDHYKNHLHLAFPDHDIKCHWTQDQNVDWYPDPFAPHRYDSNKADENTIAQTFRQWHCGMIGFHLIPKGYDIYVRVRTDLKFNGKLDYSKYDCTGKTIYIPEGNDFSGINDQFAFGNHEVMKIYYSVYLNCHDLWHEGVKFNSEGMQLANLQKNGVKIVRIPSPQHHIVR